MQTMTTRVSVPYPDAAPLSLLLRLGPCRVRITGSDGPEWISGSYEDPSEVVPIEIRTDRGAAVIAQRFSLSAGIGAVSAPVLELAIGRSHPFVLTLEVGAGDHLLDLGGLPLSAVKVSAGAGRYAMDFTAPNTVDMTALEIASGAGEVTARNVANTGAAEVRVSGGLGRSVIDFGGTLRRDMRARVDAGLAGIEVSVPAATPARFRLKTFAGGTDLIGSLQRDGDVVSTPAASGGSPLLSAEVSIAFGSITIRAT